jgi:uncharacterized protein DUF1549/uncharacterized protein DUF1553/Big-like domain-containing protein
MEFRRLLLTAPLMGVLTLPAAISGSAFGQSAPHPSSETSAQSGSTRKASASSKTGAPRGPRSVSLSGLQRIAILPSSVSLAGPYAHQRVVVEGTFSDGHEEDLTDRALFSLTDRGVAALDGKDVLIPQRDGSGSLMASLAGLRSQAQVEVTGYSTATTWSFRNDVLPVMTKVGCNSGPCHGAAAGKNGFKLTLRGYDPIADYYTLTHQAVGRRTDRLEPARSLILLKPTLAISHGGGRRFDVGSPEYQIISGWIAQGMPAPRDSDALVNEIEVLPREASLALGGEQQLVVIAKFSDGHSSDVTRWAKFDSGDEGVATVDNNGRVTMRGYGEAPVTVWYQSHVAFARLRIPFPVRLDDAIFARAPRHNYIDDLVLKHLRTLHIPPSPPASETAFIRRAYLDAAGILPTPAEVDRFLANPAPDKREKLINDLIARPEFVDYWAYKWSDLLLVSSNHLSTDEMWSYYKWIRASVAEDKPWNQFASEIVTASGNTMKNGAANYWVIHRDPLDTSENMTQAFMGINISCAHCHNHPLAKWTQKDYYGMANLFARVRLKTFAPSGFRPGTGPIFNDVTVYSAPTGEFMDDRLMIPLPPKPLDAVALSSQEPGDTRVYFARWLTAPENPFFARNIVNRVWRNFMGRGLIEPVDDLRDTNPATNEELLDALVKDFVAHNFDVDRLVRTIMESATYQTSSRPLPDNAVDDKYGSHYLIRRLPAEVLLDAYSQVTQVPEKFEGYPAGMRGLQLPDTAVKSYFLTAFGRPERQQTRESERSSVPTITQALHIINGETLNAKLKAKGNAIEMLMRLGFSDAQIVDYLYLASLSRHPSDQERTTLTKALADAEQEKPGAGEDSRRTALVDMSWALLTGEEFMFDH